MPSGPCLSGASETLDLRLRLPNLVRRYTTFGSAASNIYAEQHTTVADDGHPLATQVNSHCGEQRPAPWVLEGLGADAVRGVQEGRPYASSGSARTSGGSVGRAWEGWR